MIFLCSIIRTSIIRNFRLSGLASLVPIFHKYYCHILCPQTNFFSSNHAMKLRWGLNFFCFKSILNMFRLHTHHKLRQCILLSFDLLRFTPLLREISLTLLRVVPSFVFGSLILICSIAWTLHYRDHSAQAPRVCIIEV